MPRIKTTPRPIIKITKTTVSPEMLSEMRSFCYVLKEENYENAI